LAIQKAKDQSRVNEAVIKYKEEEAVKKQEKELRNKKHLKTVIR